MKGGHKVAGFWPFIWKTLNRVFFHLKWKLHTTSSLSAILTKTLQHFSQQVFMWTTALQSQDEWWEPGHILAPPLLNYIANVNESFQMPAHTEDRAFKHTVTDE